MQEIKIYKKWMLAWQELHWRKIEIIKLSFKYGEKINSKLNFIAEEIFLV